YSIYSNVTVENSNFDGNTAHNGGGAIDSECYNEYGATNTVITNSAFVGNKVTVSGDGGAVLNGYYGTMTINDSTFSANSVPPGHHGGAVFEHYNSSGEAFIQVNNSILWNDSPDEIGVSGPPGGGGGPDTHN